MENVMEKIAKLIYDYSINKKFADNNFTETVISLCINTLNINDYVMKHDIISLEEGCAFYSINKKSILIDITSIKNLSLNKIESDSINDIQTSDMEMYTKVNLKVVYMILHELTHAYQYKKCLEGNNDLEKALLELSLESNLVQLRKEKISNQKAMFYTKQQEFYQNHLYYLTIPSERMANINALKFVYDTSMYLPNDLNKNITIYNEASLLTGKIITYDNSSPTAYFISINEQLKKYLGFPYGETDIDIIEEKYINKDLSLDERLYLGLPIEKEEKQELLEKIKILKNKLK